MTIMIPNSDQTLKREPVMLSTYQILRQVRSNKWATLLQGLTTNGLLLPLPLRARLEDEPVAVVGLALRRVVELSYTFDDACRELADWLLARQNGDGTFGGGAAGSSGDAHCEAGAAMDHGEAGDPLATACAAAGLAAVADQWPWEAGPEVQRAGERAMLSLGAWQGEDGLLGSGDDRTATDRARISAFILLLLGHDERFAAALRAADLFDFFEEHADRLARDTTDLLDVARFGAPMHELAA